MSATRNRAPGSPLRFRMQLVFGILLGVCLLVTFQNCTQPADLGNVDQNSVMSQNLDFAYDTAIDQIAYMSCPQVVNAQKVPVDSDLYFTFRAGAYHNGGIKLTDAFYNTVQKKLPDYMASILSGSPANNNTVLQLAVRQVGSLNQIVQTASSGTTSGNPTQNVEFANLLAQLGGIEISTALVNNGMSATSTNLTLTEKRTKTLRDGTGRGAHLEGNLNFGLAESMQESLRSQYLGTGAALLALTYLEPTQSGGAAPGGGTSIPDTNVRNPGTAFPATNPNTPGLAYGTGFQLTFSQPVAGAVGLMNANNQMVLPYPSNVLTMVTEKNLLTGGQTGAQWVCPTSLQFKIIRPGDEGDAISKCNHVQDPPKPWSREWTVLRNALRTEDWYVDPTNRCILPKRSSGFSCYGDMTTMTNVQYDLTKSCDPNSDTTSNPTNGAANAIGKICAAWVSVCYRADM